MVALGYSVSKTRLWLESGGSLSEMAVCLAVSAALLRTDSTEHLGETPHYTVIDFNI